LLSGRRLVRRLRLSGLCCAAALAKLTGAELRRSDVAGSLAVWGILDRRITGSQAIVAGVFRRGC